MNPDYIGIRLRLHRNRRKISIRSLAKESGVAPSAISAVELGYRGGKNLTAESLVKLCRALRITVDTLVGNPPESTDSEDIPSDEALVPA